MDETALVRLSQAGDSQAFETLLERHYDLMFRFAYRWCGNRSDAEDITQLACIKLARSLGQFRFESAFSSWLYGLVINCAKDWLKNQKRHFGGDDFPAPEPGSPDDQAEIPVYLRQILAMLDQMAEGFKETALLVCAEGLTHGEAAQVLSVKESTVSWRLHQIRKQLQQLQADVGPQEVKR